MALMTPLVSYKRDTITYTWSGSTMGPFPAGNYWGGATSGTMTAGDLAVSGGTISENTPTGTANNGSYFSGRCYQDPMGSSLHWAEATVGNTGSPSFFPRSTGVGVGGSSQSFTNGVFALASHFSSGPDGTQLITKVGTTLTTQTTAAVGMTNGDKIRLVITHNGTNYVYTVYKNITTQVLQWIDSTNVISPGVWVSPAFGASWSSAYFGSTGATAFACGDTIAPTTIYSYTFVASTHGPFNDWGSGYSVNASAQANNNNAPAVNGTYFSGGVYPTPLGSVTHASDATFCNIANGNNCGSGTAVAGSDTSFTNGVIAVGNTVVGGTYSTEIFTKVGSTYTSVAGGGSGAWAQGDVMRLECKFNGTNYYYSVFRNGTDTGVSWIDTTNVITPGYYAGFSFRHAYSGGQFPANGIQGTWHAADL
jgi:hypothetical protein